MKRKERELKNQIDYEENKIAKKILRRYKFEKWIYYTIFLLITITCILWAINIHGTSNLLLCLVIYIIFSSFFATRYRQHSEKLIKEALNTSICPEGFLNINIYNAKKMLVNKSAYNYTLNKIATVYIQLGEFEKAKGIIKDVEKIKNALATFKGVRRRFSFQIREEKLVYIDDYAHHPTEINAVHQAVRELYPNKKIIACFQPHLFSRTKDFIDGFAESLSQFDEILLLEIYPARELPMEGVNSSWLLSKIKNKNKRLVTKEELLTSFKNSDANVFVTIGAGDIGEMVKDVKKVLNEKI